MFVTKDGFAANTKPQINTMVTMDIGKNSSHLSANRALEWRFGHLEHGDVETETSGTSCDFGPNEPCADDHDPRRLFLERSPDGLGIIECAQRVDAHHGITERTRTCAGGDHNAVDVENGARRQGDSQGCCVKRDGGIAQMCGQVERIKLFVGGQPHSFDIPVA